MNAKNERPNYLPPREEILGFAGGALAAPDKWVVEEQADLLDAVIERAVTARLNRSNDWHQQRYDRLWKWAQEEVVPLSETVANHYFAIVANGSASPFESADWSNTLHGMRLTLEAERARHAREVERAKSLLESLKKHLELLAPSATQHSTTYQLTCAALAALDGDGGGR